MKSIIFFFFSLTITSCSIQANLTEPNNFTLEQPRINSIKEVEVGVTLVSKLSEYRLNAIVLTKNAVISINNINLDFQKGQIFINDSHTNDYDLYSNIDDKSHGIAIPKNFGTFKAFTKSVNSKIFFGDDTSIEYSDTIITVPKKKNLKQEFIYNGRVNNAIKFTYREFIDDYARAAFTQDLQYDLNESNIIGFRGLRIEVISATNTKITYKVQNYFTD